MKRIIIIPVIIIGAFFGSCKKNGDSNNIPNYTVPTTYNFSTADYTSQKMLIAMADQIGAQINLANTTPNTPISLQKLTDYFNNTNNPFNDSALSLNASGLKLSNYYPAQAKTDMLNYLDSVNVYSQSSATAAPGVPGVGASSVSPSKKLLLSPKGVFYSQVAKKQIMGIFAFQIANAYLKDSINNSTDVGKLSHYWDVAFGFWGVPVDFPTNTKGLKYFGSYSNQVNGGLNCNVNIMNAFLKGRAAISNNDLTTMKAQAGILARAFDTLNAACVVQEMHETNANLEAGDAVSAYGTLSEALGFVRNMKYNTGVRVITDAQLTQLLQLFDNANPNQPGLYAFVGVKAGLTVAQIEAKTKAIEQFIGTLYGFSSSQLALL